jgi:hypothetical protein
MITIDADIGSTLQENLEIAFETVSHEGVDSVKLMFNYYPIYIYPDSSFKDAVKYYRLSCIFGTVFRE